MNMTVVSVISAERVPRPAKTRRGCFSMLISDNSSFKDPGIRSSKRALRVLDNLDRKLLSRKKNCDAIRESMSQFVKPTVKHRMVGLDPRASTIVRVDSQIHEYSNPVQLDKLNQRTATDAMNKSRLEYDKRTRRVVDPRFPSAVPPEMLRWIGTPYSEIHRGIIPEQGFPDTVTRQNLERTFTKMLNTRLMQAPSMQRVVNSVGVDPWLRLYGCSFADKFSSFVLRYSGFLSRATLIGRIVFASGPRTDYYSRGSGIGFVLWLFREWFMIEGSFDVLLYVSSRSTATNIGRCLGLTVFRNSQGVTEISLKADRAICHSFEDMVHHAYSAAYPSIRTSVPDLSRGDFFRCLDDEEDPPTGSWSRESLCLLSRFRHDVETMRPRVLRTISVLEDFLNNHPQYDFQTYPKYAGDLGPTSDGGSVHIPSESVILEHSLGYPLRVLRCFGAICRSYLKQNGMDNYCMMYSHAFSDVAKRLFHLYYRINHWLPTPKYMRFLTASNLIQVLNFYHCLQVALPRMLRRLWLRHMCGLIISSLKCVKFEVSPSDLKLLHSFKPIISCHPDTALITLLRAPFPTNPPDVVGLGLRGGVLRANLLNAETGGLHPFYILPSPIRAIVLKILSHHKFSGSLYRAAFGPLLLREPRVTVHAQRSNPRSLSYVCTCGCSCACSLACGLRRAVALLAYGRMPGLNPDLPIHHLHLVPKSDRSKLVDYLVLPRVYASRDGLLALNGGPLPYVRPVQSGPLRVLPYIADVLCATLSYNRLGNHAMHCTNGNISACAHFFPLYVLTLGHYLMSCIPNNVTISSVSFHQQHYDCVSEWYVTWHDVLLSTRLKVHRSGSHLFLFGVMPVTDQDLPIIQTMWDLAAIPIQVSSSECFTSESCTQDYRGMRTANLSASVFVSWQKWIHSDLSSVLAPQLQSLSVRFLQSLGQVDIDVLKSHQKLVSDFSNFFWLYKLFLNSHSSLSSSLLSFATQHAQQSRSSLYSSCFDWYDVKGYICLNISSPLVSYTSGNVVRSKRHNSYSSCSIFPPKCHHTRLNLETQELSGVVTPISDLDVVDYTSDLAATISQHNKEVIPGLLSFVTNQSTTLAGGLLHNILTANVFDRRFAKLWFLRETMDRLSSEETLSGLFAVGNATTYQYLMSANVPEIAAVLVTSRASPRQQLPPQSGSTSFLPRSVLDSVSWSLSVYLPSDIGTSVPNASLPSSLWLLTSQTRLKLREDPTYNRWVTLLYRDSKYRVPVVILMPNITAFEQWLCANDGRCSVRSILDPYSWIRVSSPLLIEHHSLLTIGTTSVSFVLDEGAWSNSTDPVPLTFDSYSTYRSAHNSSHYIFEFSSSTPPSFSKFFSLLPDFIQYLLMDHQL